MSYRTRRWRWLWLGLALLGCAGAGWLVLTVLDDSPRGAPHGSGHASAGGDGSAHGATIAGATDDTADSSGAAGSTNGNGNGTGDDPRGVVPRGDQPGPSVDQPDPASDDPLPQPDNPANPTDPAGVDNPDPAQPADPATVAPPAPAQPRLPRSARDPTRRELAERQRYRNGSRLPTAEDLPEAIDESPIENIDIANIADPEVWAAYWAQQGVSAPEMIATPVVGKVIDQLTHKGLAGATVWLTTFFPAGSRLDGPLLPLVVYTRTDDNGFFAFNLPVPETWPADYPRLALGLSSGGRRLIDAITLDTLRPGEPNEIGVFWAPHEPFRVQVDVARLDDGLRVVCTGTLDPLRWDARVSGDALRSYSATPIAGLSIMASGTWDPIGEPPFMTLTRDGQPQVTRRCVVRPSEEVTDHAPPPSDADNQNEDSGIGEPFRPLVFPNDGLLALNGTIVDASGEPIEGAVLTLRFGGEERKRFTDSWGWFSFANLPDRAVSLDVVHEQFVDESFADLRPGSPDMQLTMRFARPKLPFRFRRTDTGEAVNEIWIRQAQIISPGQKDEHVADETAGVRTATDGTYLIESSLPLKWLIVEAAGLVPQALPVSSSNPPDVPLDVWLQAGRTFERQPRNWDAVQNAGEWHRSNPEDPDGDPGIWSLNDDHWVDYTFELGAEAGFALVLGVKNQSYNTLPLDHEYTFEVDILLDNVKVGRLSIPCDATVPRLARLPLGRLSGPHTVRLLWTNDRFIPGQLDANIRYEQLQLIETGTPD